MLLKQWVKNERENLGIFWGKFQQYTTGPTSDVYYMGFIPHANELYMTQIHNRVNIVSIWINVVRKINIVVT